MEGLIVLSERVLSAPELEAEPCLRPVCGMTDMQCFGLRGWLYSLEVSEAICVRNKDWPEANSSRGKKPGRELMRMSREIGRVLPGRE